VTTGALSVKRALALGAVLALLALAATTTNAAAIAWSFAALAVTLATTHYATMWPCRGRCWA
jgi:4-hydroxybenzoate polyprenyltransferase